MTTALIIERNATLHDELPLRDSTELHVDLLDGKPIERLERDLEGEWDMKNVPERFQME